MVIKMNFEEFKKEVIKYFVFVTLRRMEDEKRFTGLPDIKFVFNDEGIKYFKDLIKESMYDGIYHIFNTLNINDTYYLERGEVVEALDVLKKHQENFLKYDNGIRKINSNTFFIKVPKIDEFFDLLSQIVYLSMVKVKENNEFDNEFLTSLWLRMNPSDLDDVNRFLKRELSFMKSDYLIDKGYFLETELNIKNKYDLCFETRRNDNWYETNYHLRFSLVDTEKQFTFPMIHYGLSEENGKKVCYIYAIQDDKSLIRNADIESDLQSIKKSLRNKYVKYTFLLSLKYFIELLKEYNIEMIKVPLMQVMNYAYHENLSLVTENIFPMKYSESKQKVYEKFLSKGMIDEELLEYQNDKEWFNKFHDKQDIISKNKTERLIETFMVLNEKCDLIEILNDPFIEDENLNIKIKK